MAKIAYITTCFGSLTHTFIRREVIELQKLGLNLTLFGIRPNIYEKLSEEEKGLVAETYYLYPLNIINVLYANTWFIIHNPSRYFKTLFLAFYTFFSALINEKIDLCEHLKLIYHFFVSPYMAIIMRENNVRHIHAHFPNVAASIAMYCSSLLGISFSITIHSAPISPYNGITGIKTKLKRAKFICAVSEYNLGLINEIYPCREKSYVVRCGIDVNKDEISKRCSLVQGQRALKLLAVGRFVEVKGFRYLIEAAHILKQENLEFELSMAGDGKLKSELEELARCYRLDGNVIFKGHLTPLQIKEELNKHDILIVPSVKTEKGEQEGIPFVIMEAMASGTLVIATNHAGIPELVKDRKTGILVSEKNPKEIAKAITLLKDTPDLKTTFICNAAKLLEEEFNIHKTARIMQKLLQPF